MIKLSQNDIGIQKESFHLWSSWARASLLSSRASFGPLGSIGQGSTAPGRSSQVLVVCKRLFPKYLHP